MVADLIDPFGPTRRQSGLWNPNFRAAQPPEMASHGFLAPHERTDYFEQNPRQAFQAFSGLFGTGDKRRSLEQSLSPIMDIYLGNLGQQILGGSSPQGGFVDFLAGTRGYDKPFDFDQFYNQENPGATERSDAAFQPSIRYLY